MKVGHGETPWDWVTAEGTETITPPPSLRTAQKDYRTHIGQSMTVKPTFGRAATVRQSSG